MDLTNLISAEDLFKFEVESGVISQVILLLNDHIKSQNARIVKLEEKLSDFVTNADFDDFRNKNVSRFCEIEKGSQILTSSVETISRDFSKTEKRISKELEEKMNEITISTNTQVNSMMANFESTFSSINNQIKEIVKNQPKFDQSKDIKAINQRIDDLVKKTLPMQEEITDLRLSINSLPPPPLPPSYSGKITQVDIHIEQEPMKIVPAEETRTIPPPVFIDNSSKLTEQLEKLYLETESMVNTKLNHFFNSMTKTPKLPPQIIPQPVDPSIIQQISQLKEAINQNSRDVANVNIFVSSLEDKFRGILEKNQQDTLFDEELYDDIVHSMQSIHNELYLLRNHVDGIDHLPELDLSVTIPRFFANTQLLDIPKKAQTKELENPKGKISEQKSDRQLPPIPPQNPNSFLKPQQKVEVRMIAPPRRPSVENSPRVVTVTKAELSDTEVTRIKNLIKNDLSFDDAIDFLRENLKKNQEILSSIDRKVDKEFIERLFDKFRELISSLHERIDEISSNLKNYSTKGELNNVIEKCGEIHKRLNQSVAVKKGSNCLFCGRSKTSLIGEMSPRSVFMCQHCDFPEIHPL